MLTPPMRMRLERRIALFFFNALLVAAILTQMLALYMRDREMLSRPVSNIDIGNEW